MRGAALLAALLAPAARAQQPALVEVALAGVGSVTVEARLAADSEPVLPAWDVWRLLGLGSTPPQAWVALAALRRDWPTVAFTWDPRGLRVLVVDDAGVLPAVRAARARLDRAVRGAPGLAVRSGPFLALTGDDAGRQLWEGGWAWRGRVAVTGRRSSTYGNAWGATLAPWPALYVTYAGGDRLPPQVSGRVALGPVWVASTWTPARTTADALLQVGRVSLFASSRDAYAVTLNARPIGLQLGRIGKRTTAKLTYGPVPPSPFAPPVAQ